MTGTWGGEIDVCPNPDPYDPAFWRVLSAKAEQFKLLNRTEPKTVEMDYITFFRMKDYLFNKMNVPDGVAENLLTLDRVMLADGFNSLALIQLFVPEVTGDTFVRLV